MIDKRILELLPENKSRIIKVVSFKLLSLVCSIAILFAIKMWVDFEVENIFKFAFTLGLLFILKLVFISHSQRHALIISNNSKTHLRDLIYNHLMRLGSLFQGKISSSSIAQLMSEGVEQLETYYAQYIPQFFYALLSPLILFLVLSRVNLKVSLILLVLVPLIPLSIVFVQKIAKRFLSKYWDSYLGLGSSFLDSLQGLGTLKSFQMDQMMHDRINNESESFRKATMRVLIMQLNSISVMDLVAYGGAALAIIAAYFEYNQGTLSLGSFLLFVLISSEFFIPMRQLGSYFHIAMNGAAAFDKIFDFLSLDVEEDTANTLESFTSFEANNLSFSYPEKQVLKHVNFKINKGEWVSFVGASGSGKSTLLSILARHLIADNITINNEDLSMFSKESYYKSIHLVSSQSELFKGTVRSNLEFSGITSEAAMWHVLKQVNLDEYVASNKGLDSVISERGSNLSGGEKQRLILARALLWDAEVYLFDEVTSSVDVESEAIIMSVIESMKDKTVVLVSHRLQNVRNSSKIYVLEDAAIVESGSHSALMQNQGKYYSLFETQRRLENYEEA